MAKRIAALRRNPKNVRPAELDAVLIAAGFTFRQQGTSHKVYTHGSHRLIIPQRHPFLLSAYVVDALSLLDQLAGGETNGSDD